MLRWLCTSKRRSSRPCLRGLSDTVRFTHPCTFLVCCPDFCMYVHTHTRMHARMHACMNMRACTHACMYERGWTAHAHMYACTNGCELPRNQIARNSSLFLVYTKVYSYMCVCDVTHAYLSPNKNEICWLTHTYTHTYRYAYYPGQSQTHGGPTLHSS